MRIIHVVPALTKGGGEKVAVDLANMAHAHGNNVSFVLGRPVDPELLQKSIHPSIPIYFIAKSKTKAFLKIPFWLLSNRKLLLGTDIVHCHLLYSSIFAVFLFCLKKITGKPTPKIISTNHTIGMGISTKIRWLLAKFSWFDDGTVFMALDDYWTKFIKAHPQKRIAVIPNGVALPPAKPEAFNKVDFAKSLQIKEDEPLLIGTIGMLRPDRRPWVYPALFEAIYNKLGERVHFVLGGDGPAFQEVHDLIKGKPYETNFHMIGLVSDPHEIMPVLDIYVSLSVGEITGISMIEAAMNGVPVVGIQLVESHQRSSRDWVWSDANLTTVADKMVYFLNNRNELQRYGIEQKTFVRQKFTAENMYHSYQSFYEEVLANANGRQLSETTN